MKLILDFLVINKIFKWILIYTIVIVKINSLNINTKIICLNKTNDPIKNRFNFSRFFQINKIKMSNNFDEFNNINSFYILIIDAFTWLILNLIFDIIGVNLIKAS